MNDSRRSERDRTGSSAETDTFQRYYEVVRERVWVVIACAVLVTAAAGAYVKTATKMYTAQSLMGVSAASPNDPVLAALPVLRQSGDPTEDVLTAASLVTTPQVAQAVSSQLNLHVKPATLLGDITATPEGQASEIAVQAQSDSPQRAMQLANAFVTQTIAVHTAAMDTAINKELPALQREASLIPLSQRFGTGSLGQTIQELQFLLSSGDPTLTSLSSATLPTSPTSPKTKLTLIAGLIGGIVLGIAFAFAFHALDPRLRREEQLRDLLGWPVLARIPRERRGRRRPTPLLPNELSVLAQEGYRTLRTMVTLSKASSPASDSRAYLVTGTGPGEGKSTTAINLAAALGQTGASVILIEADLRRPTFADAFGLSSFSGTEQVLTDEVDLAVALAPVLFGDVPIRVLAARRAGAELADRLSGSAVRRLVDGARALADYVVIDSPPLTTVVDGLPFAQLADEVIVVTRVETTRLNKLVELDELLRQNRARASGLVVVGDTRRAESYYGNYGTPVSTVEEPALGPSNPRSGWPVK